MHTLKIMVKVDSEMKTMTKPKDQPGLTEGRSKNSGDRGPKS